eukprot:2846692-Rhodomonas_salina.1
MEVLHWRNELRIADLLSVLDSCLMSPPLEGQLWVRGDCCGSVLPRARDPSKRHIVIRGVEFEQQ